MASVFEVDLICQKPDKLISKFFAQKVFFINSEN
jgi:hypothetical protein